MAVEAETRFSPLPTKPDEEKLSAARTVLATAFATISEGLLLTALLDKKLSPEARISKIRTQFERIKGTEKTLKMPVQPLMHEAILEKASKMVLNTTAN